MSQLTHLLTDMTNILLLLCIVKLTSLGFKTGQKRLVGAEVKESKGNRRGYYRKLSALKWPLIMIVLDSMNHSNDTTLSLSHTSYRHQ